MNTPAILEINNLSIGYKKAILKDINATANPGEVILLTGKNGSGKTTLLKTIYKELICMGGNIKIMGQNSYHISSGDLSKFISVVLSQNSIGPSLRLFDLISLGRFPYKKWYQKLTRKETETIYSIIDLFELTPYTTNYACELSDGNLQKAMIARAIIQDCPLLILDEPTSHLDIANKLKVIKLIREYAKDKRKAVVFTSHDLSLGLSISDKLWLIKDQQWISGYTEDVAFNENVLDYFVSSDMKFNYQNQEYEINKPENHLTVRLEGNRNSIYWLKKALVRNGFTIHESSEIIISELNSNYIIHFKTENLTFPSIEKVILYLRNHLKKLFDS
ncbi:ABC transporter ATP-binding protein [Apibacter raozihei]|uniref:ABC transporter ATP-binding protein n=1 Tax=Apibacter raozihei TaxID=2500547 RepID=UPI000FE2D33E|nr:ABC transporter ATP-binding protein [Apibacter raozihei]